MGRPPGDDDSLAKKLEKMVEKENQEPEEDEGFEDDGNKSTLSMPRAASSKKLSVKSIGVHLILILFKHC